MSFATNATSSSSGNWNAGSWTITPSRATGGAFNPANYAISYNAGALTVNQAPLTIAANNQTMTYGGGNNFTAGYTPSGLVAGDTIGSMSFATNATSSSSGNWNAGSWTITPSGATGGTFNAANYAISYNAGALTVNQAPLTIAANNQTLTYGGGNNFTAAYTPSGLVAGDTIGSMSFATNATSSSSGNWNAGSWTITPSRRRARRSTRPIMRSATTPAR